MEHKYDKWTREELCDHARCLEKMNKNAHISLDKCAERLACAEESARKAGERARKAEQRAKEAEARVAELEKENDQLWLLPPYVAKQPDGTKANAFGFEFTSLRDLELQINAGHRSGSLPREAHLLLRRIIQILYDEGLKWREIRWIFRENITTREEFNTRFKWITSVISTCRDSIDAMDSIPVDLSNMDELQKNWTESYQRAVGMIHQFLDAESVIKRALGEW